MSFLHSKTRLAHGLEAAKTSSYHAPRLRDRLEGPVPVTIAGRTPTHLEERVQELKETVNISFADVVR